jgi:predicted amidophosphoribosyltransferase
MPMAAAQPDQFDPSYLHPYHPYRSGKFDSASGRILDFKKGQQYAFRHYLKEFDEKLPADSVLCAVPSHAPGGDGEVRELARRLAGRRDRRTDATACLVRHTKIQKLSEGGCRRPEMHLRSIRVEQADLIRGRDVILIDDVTTTGNSFKACRQLLLDAGAASVHCVALSKTMR